MFKNEILADALIVAVVLIGVAGIWYIGYLRKAHSTFENYYSFRGCTKLLEKTADYGTCVTVKGQTIKMVKYQNKWYLDGDLPVCWGSVCF